MHKELVRDSEHKRHDLQVHITQTGVAVHQNADENLHYQDQLISEADQLRAEIQSLKQVQARKEQEYGHTLEDVNQSHKVKVDALTREHHDKVTVLSNDSQAKVDRL